MMKTEIKIGDRVVFDQGSILEDTGTVMEFENNTGDVKVWCVWDSNGSRSWCDETDLELIASKPTFEDMYLWFLININNFTEAQAKDQMSLVERSYVKENEISKMISTLKSLGYTVTKD